MLRFGMKDRGGWIAAGALLGTVVLIAAGLAALKVVAVQRASAEAANQPEPVEAVTAARAVSQEHRETATAIGTVLALRSITLRNELAGTVSDVRLTPGRVVASGELLVALDVSVEKADLEAEQAQAALAQTTFERLSRLRESGAASQEELDQARAERDVAEAQIARTKAIIARKTIRAPFPARVGIADVHVGQYLNEGTQLTTLQGVADAAHVDFDVSQDVAATLRQGESVQVVADGGKALPARIVAIDARVDPVTRNATVRARIDGDETPSPGASVRVEIPVGAAVPAVLIPASALRKGPAGDHVFVLSAGEDGKTRAHVRAVTSGPIVGDDVVILGGLEADEQVAASGSFKLRDGVLVAVEGGPAAGAGGAK